MKISIIGTGRVATHLALAFYKAGITIVEIFGRTPEKAQLLAQKVNASPISDIAQMSQADIFICSVKDDALETLLQKSNFKNSLVVHTAGSLDMDILQNFSENIGVFYPLQTFSFEKEINWENTPLFIEANSDKNLKELTKLANKISKKVTVCSSENRRNIHISAVFVCNFSNHMYAIGEKLMQDANLSFDMLLPLINETSKKVNTVSPKLAQTGPAVRYDRNVIDKHLAALSNEPNLQEIYQLLTENIHKFATE